MRRHKTIGRQAGSEPSAHLFEKRFEAGGDGRTIEP
jgi:hypothetical protein